MPNHKTSHHLKKLASSDYGVLAVVWVAILTMFFLLITMIYGGFGSAMNHFQTLGNRVVYVVNMHVSNISTLAESEDESLVTGIFASCDLDRNRECDSNDFDIFKRSLSTCSGEPGYDSDSDITNDGCVLGDDWEILFPDFFSSAPN